MGLSAPPPTTDPAGQLKVDLRDESAEGDEYCQAEDDQGAREEASQRRTDSTRGIDGGTTKKYDNFMLQVISNLLTMAI